MRGRKSNADARRQQIIALTTNGRFVRPADIAKELKVSGETVRRDLLALEESGDLQRVHGGALSPPVVNPTEPSRGIRSAVHQQEKSAIAELAVAQVDDDDTLFLDVGTTVEAAAAALPPTFHGVVVTHSLAVATVLGDRNLEVIVLGGRLRVGEMSMYGPATLNQLQGYNATVALLGSGGSDLEAGMTDYSMEDVAVKQLMIERASRTFILGASDKFGKRATRYVCALVDVTGVITGSPVSSTIRTRMLAASVNVLVAP